MVYKLFNEPGDWQIIETGERCVLIEANAAWTPEGLNVGWTEFTSIEEAAKTWGLTPWTQNTEINEESN